MNEQSHAEPDVPVEPTLADHLQNLLKSAGAPLPLGDLKKQLKPLYPKGNKKQPRPPMPSEEEITAVLESEGFYRHEGPGGKGKVKYALTAPLSITQLTEQAVREKVATLGDEPVKVNKLGKPGPKMGQEAAAAFDNTIAKLVAEGKLFAYPKGEYATKAPPSIAELTERDVREKVATLGDEPVKVGKLGKPGGKQGPEAAEAFDNTIAKLVAEGKLFAYPKGEYGTKAPPQKPWYEVAPAKADFGKILTHSTRLFDHGVAPQQLLGELQRRFGSRSSPSPTNGTKAVDVPKPVVPTPAAPPVAPVITDLRTAIKAAYDHLCRFVEFRDKLVEIPRLYHEVKERRPSTSVQEFKDELWKASSDRIIELHEINEVHMAKEPELAIHRDDRLYYFIRWQ